MCKACHDPHREERPDHENPDYKMRRILHPPKPVVQEHGTRRGCRQHWSRGEDLCDQCHDFHWDFMAERRAKKEREKIVKKMAKKRKTVKTRNTGVRLTVSSLDELDEMAVIHGVSRNVLIQRAIDAYLVM